MGVDETAVSYGIERLNQEVSHWMRGHNNTGCDPEIPFIATRGYDSVVWNRLYSGEILDRYDYQNDQVRLHIDLVYSYLLWL